MVVIDALQALAVAATVFGTTSHATPVEVSKRTTSNALVHRAFPDSPSGGYAPSFVRCPTNATFLREADRLHPEERRFRRLRHAKARPEIMDFLKRANMEDFSVDQFFAFNVEGRGAYTPNYGIAFSGGGYRAMLNGGGYLKAFDLRSEGSIAEGGVGGVLQGATYLSGLSGGSWAIGSMVINNFTTVGELQKSEIVWDLETSIIAPEGKTEFRKNLDYFSELKDQVTSKRDAGFTTSFSDFWSAAISRQIIMSPEDDGGAAVTFSSIRDTETYKEAEMPFPIVVALSRDPNEVLISLNSTVFEINPIEMGSFDPQLHQFSELKWVGSNVTDGVPEGRDACVNGFDNAGFVLGTSSSLFNYPLLQINNTEISDLIKDVAVEVLESFFEDGIDVAVWSPNPFYASEAVDSKPITSNRTLALVDGGLDLQNIPLQPLIQPERQLELVIAIDSSADVNNWPNGTAMVATYQRSLRPEQNMTSFPKIPGVNTFVNLGLNNRPTLFGCEVEVKVDTPEIPRNATNYPPLIFYLPNTPITYYSNISTFTSTYETSVRDAIIENGFQGASRGMGKLDKEWPACLGCAMIRREEQRRGTEQTAQCKRCFERYCWDGREEESEVRETYEPEVALEEKKSAAVVGRGVSMWGVMVVVVVGLWVV